MNPFRSKGRRMRFFQTIRPSHLGLLFVHMWIYCSTHRDTETGGVSVMAIMYVALSLCLVIVLLRSFKTSFSAGAKSASTWVP